MVDNNVYQYKMTDNFIPYRRNKRYVPSRTVKIHGLLDKQTCLKNKVVGEINFDSVNSEINREDFMIIANKMLGDCLEKIPPNELFNLYN